MDDKYKMEYTFQGPTIVFLSAQDKNGIGI